MKISIAIATFNGVNYLQAQLDSFLSQTRLPDELVITDDCSTDKTLEMIQHFAATAPFPVIWSQNGRNLGYGGNFNTALMQTTGDLVFLSDQDDVWFPEKIERIEAIAKEDIHSLVIMNDAALTDAELNPVGLTKLGQIHSAGFKESFFVMGCCVAVKRDMLNLCLPIPNDYPAHDVWIVRIAEGMGRKRVVREVLQYYRRHEKNESQFIVNRTTRVTRLHVILSDLKHGLGQNFKVSNLSNKHTNSSNYSQVIMLEWAYGAVLNTSNSYKHELKKFSEYLEANVAAQKKRDAIRQLPFSHRLVQVLLFWKRGGYVTFSGMKTMIRDIILF